MNSLGFLFGMKRDGERESEIEIFEGFVRVF